MTTPRNQTHLAELLGIAKSAVSAQAKRGMPTDSLQAAQMWRTQHIDPARKKGARLDAHYRPSQRDQPTQQAPEPATVAHAADLMNVAHAALEAGQPIDALVPLLRAALRAVPVPERASLGLSLPVMRALLKHVLDVLPDPSARPTDQDGSPFYIDGETLSADDAEFTGAIWYEIAAGELVFDLDALAAFYGTAAP